MSYPSLTVERAQELAELLRIEANAGGDPLIVYLNEDEWCTPKMGDDYERPLIERAAEELRTATASKVSSRAGLSANEQYELEAEMARHIHLAVRQLSIDLQEDEDFWRYLALFPFRWYLLAREPELQPQDFGGYSELVDEKGEKRRQRKGLVTQLIYRTFLWGKIAYDETEKAQYRRATSISKLGGPSIDVWHSHLIRTQLGQLGELPHSFLDAVEKIKPANTMKNVARKTEKRLTRMKHNVLFDVYSKSDADTVVSEQMSRVV